jgi:hypothetical protein
MVALYMNRRNICIFIMHYVLHMCLVAYIHCIVQLSLLTESLDTHNGKWRSDADFVLVFTCNSRTWLIQRVLWVAHADNNEQTYTYSVLGQLYSFRGLLSLFMNCWRTRGSTLLVCVLFPFNLSTWRRTWFYQDSKNQLEKCSGMKWCWNVFCWSEYNLKAEITRGPHWYCSSHFLQE